MAIERLDDYLDDILIRLAYHSNRIEGNTITLPDTVRIIRDDKTPKEDGKSIREVFEILNHRSAFEYVIENAQKYPITMQTIKDLHGLLADRLLYDKGTFKQSSNRIVGANFQTASPEETPVLLHQLVQNNNYREETARTERELIETVADTHIQFERIHPFSDFNGRTGRLLMSYSLIRHDLPPLVIDSQQKSEYYYFLSTQDVKGFSDFIEQQLEEERDIIQGFSNMHQQHILDPEFEM